MNRILMLTTEPLPVPGLPATGAGLRAWGLAQGLRRAGLEVRLLMPRDAAATFASQNAQPGAAVPQTHDWPEWVGVFDRAALAAAVRAENPDAIVLQHWGLARELGEVDCPLAIDLAGPHLLERRLWGSQYPEQDLHDKLDALRRADFLIASGERQRLYFLPYLNLAGWDITAPDALPVIPFSFLPTERPAPVRPDRLVYGGFFLPWQDPSRAIETALDAMEQTGQGELLFVGGAHPTLDVSRGRFDVLLARLKQHPRVRVLEPMSYDKYSALLSEGGVALDLMACNPERELAFTTRTVVYMAHGLPVIHDNYSELGEIIQRSGAGWAVDPEDSRGLAGLLEKLFCGELDPAPQAQAAHELVKTVLSWKNTTGPLIEFCRAPHFRQNKMSARLAFEEQSRRLRQLDEDLSATRAKLATLEGKRWVRWGIDLTSGHTLIRIPAALLVLLMSLLLIPVFLINDWIGGRSGKSDTMK